MGGHSPDAQYFWSATDQAGLLVACVWPLTVMLIEGALQTDVSDKLDSCNAGTNWGFHPQSWSSSYR